MEPDRFDALTRSVPAAGARRGARVAVLGDRWPPSVCGDRRQEEKEEGQQGQRQVPAADYVSWVPDSTVSDSTAVALLRRQERVRATRR